MDPWRPGTWGFEGVNPNPPTENPIQAEYDQWRREYDAGVAEYNRIDLSMRLLTLGPIGVLRQQFNRWLRFFFVQARQFIRRADDENRYLERRVSMDVGEFKRLESQKEVWSLLRHKLPAEIVRLIRYDGIPWGFMIGR